MTWDIINIVLGVAVGLVTGFYFERRATKQAQAQHDQALVDNARLRERIGNLEEMIRTNDAKIENSVKHVQESVYSTAHFSGAPARSTTAGLDAINLLAEIRVRVDVQGQASLPSLRHSFVAKGFAPSDFDTQLEGLVATNKVRVTGKLVELL